MDYLWCHLLIWTIGTSSYHKSKFGYKCGVQVSTKFFPFMVLIGRTPRLTCDNGLFAFTNVEKDEFTLDEMTQLMVEKFKLISNMHSSMLENVDQT